VRERGPEVRRHRCATQAAATGKHAHGRSLRRGRGEHASSDAEGARPRASDAARRKRLGGECITLLREARHIDHEILGFRVDKRTHAYRHRQVDALAWSDPARSVVHDLVRRAGKKQSAARRAGEENRSPSPRHQDAPGRMPQTFGPDSYDTGLLQFALAVGDGKALKTLLGNRQRSTSDSTV